MNKWKLWQYRNIVESFLAECGEAMYEMLARRLDLLSEKGNECKHPISDPLGGGLFELRGRAGKQQARLIYYFASNRTIIFVHAFYKTEKAISRHDMETAKRIKTIIQEGREKAYDVNLTY